MFCTKCGKSLPDASKFCIYCGAPVKTIPAPAPQPESQPAPQPAVVPQPEPQPEPEPEVVPQPEPQPEPEPEVVPQPEPQPEPEPEVVPQPEPVPEVVPEPAPQPEPDPEVVPEPAPQPDPQPLFIPRPEPEMIPPKAEPQPLFIPRTQPQAAPQPQPAAGTAVADPVQPQPQPQPETKPRVREEAPAKGGPGVGSRLTAGVGALVTAVLMGACACFGLLGVMVYEEDFWPLLDPVLLELYEKRSAWVAAQAFPLIPPCAVGLCLLAVVFLLWQFRISYTMGAALTWTGAGLLLAGLGQLVLALTLSSASPLYDVLSQPVLQLLPTILATCVIGLLLLILSFPARKQGWPLRRTAAGRAVARVLSAAVLLAAVAALTNGVTLLMVHISMLL